jgi:hypothetical protein
MNVYALLSRRAIVLMAAAGLFLAGFGYGNEAPSFDPAFGDVWPHADVYGHNPANFLISQEDCDP